MSVAPGNSQRSSPTVRSLGKPPSPQPTPVSTHTRRGPEHPGPGGPCHHWAVGPAQAGGSHWALSRHLTMRHLLTGP